MNKIHLDQTQRETRAIGLDIEFVGLTEGISYGSGGYRWVAGC